MINILSKLYKKGIVEVPQKKANNDFNFFRRSLYDEIDIKDIVDGDEYEDRGYLWLQGIYGYIGDRSPYYIGKNTKGTLFKIHESRVDNIDKDRIDYTSSHCVLGNQLEKSTMAKLIYKSKEEKNGPSPAAWVAYKEGVFTNDENMYCGLHFIELHNLYQCFLDSERDLYGNNLAIFKFVPDLYNEAYYRYNKCYWLGERLYTEKILDLCQIETWQFIMDNIDNYDEWRSNKKAIIEYLEKLGKKGYHNISGTISWINQNI